MKNLFRGQLGAKPRIIKVYSHWVCANANAHGEGSTPQSAFKQWQRNYHRWSNNPARLRHQGTTS